MRKILTAITELQKLAKSRYKETRRIAKELLIACSETTKISKRIEGKIEVLKARDLQRKNTQIIKKEAKAASLINLIQLTTNLEAQKPKEATKILKENMCLVNFQLVNDSKSTGEKAGTVTTRIASRIPQVWHEYNCKPTGESQKNGTIRYKDCNLHTRSFAQDKLVWIYQLSNELTEIFRNANKSMQTFYANLFTKHLNKIKQKFAINI